MFLEPGDERFDGIVIKQHPFLGLFHGISLIEKAAAQVDHATLLFGGESDLELLKRFGFREMDIVKIEGPEPVAGPGVFKQVFIVRLYEMFVQLLMRLVDIRFGNSDDEPFLQFVKFL